MPYIYIGFIGFVLLVVYDINQAFIKIKYLSSLFFIGLLFILIATIGILFYKSAFALSLFWLVFCVIMAVAFLSLMIYALFFAIPFKETYCEDNDFRLCTKGAYALCRHPAVPCFILFYLFLWLSTGINYVLVAFFVFSMSNILYSLFQDNYIFPRIFDGYKKYKENTPFIIPNTDTIKKFIANSR